MTVGANQRDGNGRRGQTVRKSLIFQSLIWCHSLTSVMHTVGIGSKRLDLTFLEFSDMCIFRSLGNARVDHTLQAL